MKIFFKIKVTFIFALVANFAFSQDWTERLKITANERANNALFGASVAISGDFAIIGANQEKKDADNSEENILTDAGAAYIFKNESGEWIFYQKIVASDRSGGDYFGHSVAIDGDFIVVGAPQEDEDENGQNTKLNTGSAYVFKNIGGNWTEIQKICASDRNTQDWFGCSVGISGNDIVIGAYAQGTDENGGNQTDMAGAVYYFKNQGGTWTETQKMVAHDRRTADYFGASLAIEGNRLVVGAYLQDYNANGYTPKTNAGAVYYLEKENNTWTIKQKLVADDRKAESNFGYSVSISGDYIIVGAHYHDESSSLTSSGAAYIFKYSSNTWEQQTKLIPSDLEANDRFGQSVAISGNYAIVGADLEDHDINGGNNFSNAGSAYLFELQDNNWVQIQKLCASDRSLNDSFGYKVAIQGYNFIVTANQEDHDINNKNYLNNSGSAYIFRKKSNLIVKKDNEIINNGQTLDFGNIVFNDDTLTISLNISTDGGDYICFTNENLFVIQGNNADNFALEFDENIDSCLNPVSTINLGVKFIPISQGLKTAQLLLTNDSEQSNFKIILKGNGIASSSITNISQNISIFPNPASSQIFIDLGKVKVDVLNIYDISGKCLITRTNLKDIINIDISNLQSGVYILNAISDNEVLNFKFIVE